jgi:hypothetical protein
MCVILFDFLERVLLVVRTTAERRCLCLVSVFNQLGGQGIVRNIVRLLLSL